MNSQCITLCFQLNFHSFLAAQLYFISGRRKFCFEVFSWNQFCSSRLERVGRSLLSTSTDPQLYQKLDMRSNLHFVDDFKAELNETNLHCKYWISLKIWTERPYLPFQPLFFNLLLFSEICTLPQTSQKWSLIIFNILFCEFMTFAVNNFWNYLWIWIWLWVKIVICSAYA